MLPLAQQLRSPVVRAADLVPGFLLAGGVAAMAGLAALAEREFLGRTSLEALVIAIVLGALVRTAWRPPVRYHPGIRCASKTVLELAVALMGASVSLQILSSVGVELLLGIVAVVVCGIAGGYVAGRAVGLSCRMALLIACGNAICGNSAIAAIAPIIKADGEDVAASIGFTAVLGVAVVVFIPIGCSLLHLHPVASGVLVGMTVYAVPQVIAAAGPLGQVAVQIGTLVKLVRVLTLGPVAGVMSVLSPAPNEEGPSHGGRYRRGLLLPWFIVAFLALALLNSSGLLPHEMEPAAASLSDLMTILAMAGLGLGVDLRNITQAGGRITAAVLTSLALLVCAALVLIRLTGVN